MAELKIFYWDLNEEAQSEIRKQISNDLIFEKEQEWEDDYNGLENELDDFIDQCRDNYIDNQLADDIDNYININDSGINYII